MVSEGWNDIGILIFTHLFLGEGCCCCLEEEGVSCFESELAPNKDDKQVLDDSCVREG